MVDVAGTQVAQILELPVEAFMRRCSFAAPGDPAGSRKFVETLEAIAAREGCEIFVGRSFVKVTRSNGNLVGRFDIPHRLHELLEQCDNHAATNR